MTKESATTGIKHWPQEDRPREKLVRKGEHTLSDSELLEKLKDYAVIETLFPEIVAILKEEYFKHLRPLTP